MAERSAWLAVDVVENDARSCDFRNCRNPGEVEVRLGEVDDGNVEDYCRPHAEVIVAAALPKLWRRFDAANEEGAG